MDKHALPKELELFSPLTNTFITTIMSSVGNNNRPSITVNTHIRPLFDAARNAKNAKDNKFLYLSIDATGQLYATRGSAKYTVTDYNAQLHNNNHGHLTAIFALDTQQPLEDQMHKRGITDLNAPIYIKNLHQSPQHTSFPTDPSYA